MTRSSDSTADARPPEPRESGDDFEPIGFDVACVHCHYNLRGMRIQETNCPECGEPVGASVNLNRYLEWKESGGTRLRLRRTRRFVRAFLLVAVLVALVPVGTCAYRAL